MSLDNTNTTDIVINLLEENVKYTKEIDLLISNSYMILQYILCLVIIYLLYKFFAHFIFGGV